MTGELRDRQSVLIHDCKLKIFGFLDCWSDKTRHLWWFVLDSSIIVYGTNGDMLPPAGSF